MRNEYLLYSLDKKIPPEKIMYLNERLKDLPDDKSAEVLAYSNLKDPITSVLLGIFLGGIGAHCFYLNEKKKGIAFAAAFAASFILLIIGLAIELAGAVRYEIDETMLYVGVAILCFSALLMFVIGIAALIDGLLSYKRAQELNLKKILSTIDDLSDRI